MSSAVSPDHQLSDLRQAVEHCRLGRRKARFPDDLKRQIVSKLEHHSLTDLALALDIGINSVSRWRQQFTQVEDRESGNHNRFPSATPEGFVALTTDNAKDVIANTYELNLVLQTEHSPQRFHLNAHITLAQWQQIAILISQAVLA